MTTPTDASKEGAPWKEAPVPMTPEQLFFFDIRGWMVLPSVLRESEIEIMKAEAYAGAKDNYSGELQRLLDHPAITGILTEILCSGENPIPYTNEQPKESLPDDTYRFRCESSAIFIRPAGWKKEVRDDGGLPHVAYAPQQAHVLRYQAAGKKIFAGVTRVFWELEEVKAGEGGTSFLSGSHKAHFNFGGPDPFHWNVSGSPWTDSIRAGMESYSCPPGSAVIFTESLVHAANDWTNTENGRCAIANTYNSIYAQHSRLNLSHERIEAMPPKRRSLFRGVWQYDGADNPDGYDTNRYYSVDNRSV